MSQDLKMIIIKSARLFVRESRVVIYFEVVTVFINGHPLDEAFVCGREGVRIAEREHNFLIAYNLFNVSLLRAK